MAFSKADLYPKTQKLPAYFARAFSHPERLAILETLKQEGPTTVQDIYKNSPLSRSVVSQHLKILREANLITFKEVPPFVVYSIDAENCQLACNHISSFLNRI